MRIPTPHNFRVILTRANERVHVQNERNFPQARLDSKINACFFLNEHYDPYILLHNYSAHVILFNLRNLRKKFGGKQTYSGKLA